MLRLKKLKSDSSDKSYIAKIPDKISKIHERRAPPHTRIVEPPFEVSNMVNRKTRKITRKTVRKMLCWVHYQFRQRLVAKAEELGVHVIVQSEAYKNLQLVWECSKNRKI